MFHCRVAIACCLVLLVGCAQTAPRPDTSSRLEAAASSTSAAGSVPDADDARTSSSEPTGVLTLREALAAAILGNPQLASAAWEIRAAAARTLQASLSPNPELGFEVEEFGGADELSGFDVAEYSISLSQDIPLGGRIGRRSEEAGIRERVAARERDSVRLDVQTEVTKAFVEVLAAQELLALAEESVRVGEEVVRVVEGQVQAGKSPPLEATKASVTQSLTVLGRDQARSDLVSARCRLAATWGATRPRFESVAGDLRGRQAVPSFESIEALLSGNPDFAVWGDTIEAHRADLVAARSEAWPDLTLTGGVKRAEEADLHSFVLGFSLPLPLFDRNQGGVGEAYAAMRQAAELQRAAEVRIRTELREAWQAMSLADVQSETLLGRVLPAAQSAFDASREGFRQGKFEYLDVLDAQRTLFEARESLIGAVSSFHDAVADVERLIGRSLSSIGEE